MGFEDLLPPRYNKLKLNLLNMMWESMSLTPITETRLNMDKACESCGNYADVKLKSCGHYACEECSYEGVCFYCESEVEDESD